MALRTFASVFHIPTPHPSTFNLLPFSHIRIHTKSKSTYTKYPIYRIYYTVLPMLIADTALRETPPHKITTTCIPPRVSHKLDLHQMSAPTQHNSDTTTCVSDRPYTSQLTVPTIYIYYILYTLEYFCVCLYTLYIYIYIYIYITHPRILVYLCVILYMYIYLFI